jgi:hypothetical protein
MGLAGNGGLETTRLSAGLKRFKKRWVENLYTVLKTLTFVSMSTKERESRYREAVRYLQNATELLRTKARKKDKYYQDEKYVRMACGTAYSATLLALNTYLEMKGKPLKKVKGRLSVDDYRKHLAPVDTKLLQAFNTAYNVLHLSGYYDGETKQGVIREGLDSAIEIINKIKPAGLEGLRLN